MLEGEAERAADHGGCQQRRAEGQQVEGQAVGGDQAGDCTEHADGQVRAERDEAGMGEVQHVHQAEDQGQAGCHQEQHHAHGQAGERQRHPG